MVSNRSINKYLQSAYINQNAALTLGFNPHRENIEIIAITTIKKKTCLAKDFENNL